MHLFLYLDVVSGSVKIVLRSAALDPIRRKKNTTSIENFFFSMFYLLNASEQHQSLTFILSYFNWKSAVTPGEKK